MHHCCGNDNLKEISLPKLFSVESPEYMPIPYGILASNVKLWGPSLWNFLHVISLEYPEDPTNDQKSAIIKLIESLQIILPCEYCRVHFNKIIEKLPPLNEALQKRETLVHWMFNLHNTVNLFSGKDVISFKDFIDDISVKSRIR